jgi:hypothetical protein
MERMERLMTVRGGVSLGRSESASDKGMISLGFETVTSNLHQDTW